MGAGTLFQFNGFCAKSIVDVSGICGETDFSGQVDAFALPNADYSIQLSVGVYGQFGGGGNAYIDPFLEIDPAWSVDHPGYSLAVSEGFGNEPLTPSAVPEPSSCALVLSGLALIGAVTALLLLGRLHERQLGKATEENQILIQIIPENSQQHPL